MLLLPPRSTRTDTPLPDTALFRSRDGRAEDDRYPRAVDPRRNPRRVLSGCARRCCVAASARPAFKGFRGVRRAGAHGFPSALHSSLKTITVRRNPPVKEARVRVTLKDVARQANVSVATVGSEARRGGKECVSTCSARWSPYN